MRTRHAPDSSSLGPVACRHCDLNEVCRLCGLIALGGERTRHPTGRLRQIPVGASLYRTGTPASCLYAVRQGLLRIVHVTAEGDEHTLGIALPGEVLGLETFAHRAYATDAVALQPTVCCELPLPLLEQEGTRVRELAEALIRLLSSSITPRLERARGSIRNRVTRFLLDLSNRLQRRGLDGRRFTLGLSRQQIADLLDTRIETVSRMMQRLHRERAIRVHGNTVTLLQRLDVAEAAATSNPMRG